MKQIAFVLVVLSLLAVSARSQAPPDRPAPPPPDPAWSRLQSLLRGQSIVVTNTNGPPVHCLFTSVTEAYLYCSPPGNPAGVGFRFDQEDVLGVDLDLPGGPSQARLKRTERNYHPAWISSMIAGGIVVGLCATRTTGAGNATEAGLIGAGIVGLIGAPLAFIPRSRDAYAGPIYPTYGIAIPLRSPAHLHFSLFVHAAQ
jgi:hypothetical protein